MQCFVLLLVLSSVDVFSLQSVCHGSTSSGRLENGVQLPSSGKNFESYSSIGSLAGRTFVHSTVKDIIVSAYSDLEAIQPHKVFKYAETGYAEGGKFKPHKTHQNGLSVDFMVPVIDKNGKSVHLPTHPFNKFGYNIEFDSQGRYEDFTIDYEALAAHIVSLDKQAKNRGYGLWRVIFDPKLQSYLFKTSHAQYLSENIQFSKKPSWVRHDEHYHVDFLIPCQ